MDIRPPQDSVDRSLALWAQAHPDLDLTPAAMVSRLGRLRRIFEVEIEAAFAEHGLNWAEFAMLVILQRLDQSEGVSQRQLTRELNLSSGTVSVRVERLCARELLTRHSNVNDRRNSVLQLTDAGRELVDQVAPAYAATQSRLLAALSAEQWEQLTSILRTLLISFEGSTSDATFPYLGLTLAPAHLGLCMRRSVGLPDVVGLLVQGVEPDSRADEAGIAVGDVLVSASDRELRSITTLYAAINDARDAGAVALTCIRGTDTAVEVTVILDLQQRQEDGFELGNTTPDTDDTAHKL